MVGVMVWYFVISNSDKIPRPVLLIGMHRDQKKCRLLFYKKKPRMSDVSPAHKVEVPLSRSWRI